MLDDESNVRFADAPNDPELLNCICVFDSAGDAATVCHDPSPRRKFDEDGVPVPRSDIEIALKVGVAAEPDTGPAKNVLAVCVPANPPNVNADIVTSSYSLDVSVVYSGCENEPSLRCETG